MVEWGLNASKYTSAMQPIEKLSMVVKTFSKIQEFTKACTFPVLGEWNGL